MATPEKHALLSASSAERWLNCPPSARLCESIEDTTSEYAESGRLAHAIAELKLCKQYIEPMGPKTFSTRLNKLKKNPLYDAEMDHTTDEYMEAIEEAVLAFPERPYIAAEQMVDFSSFVPDGFGTSDCIMIGSGILHIVDYKHGQGVAVEAENNPQMMLYALGAMLRYKDFYTIETVRMTIVQPRAGGVRSAEVAADDLINWGVDVVRPKAKLAYDGGGEQHAGDWCRFCKIKATCRKRGEYLALEAFGKNDPPTYSDAEIGTILERARGLSAWVKEIEEYALGQTLDGHAIPGWKAVAGRSVREFDNADAAFADLIAAGIDKDMLYTRKPLTLTQAEKVVGKKDFAAIVGSHIITPPGKPTLVQESDPRPAYSAAAEVFK